MKSHVTVEELNAATLLMTGLQVNHLVEIHVAGSIITAITMGEDGEYKTSRIPIGTPEAPQVEPEAIEVDEDDGNQEE